MANFGPLLGSSFPYALIVPSYRQLATLIPDCAIEEVSYDATQITDHPVEIGAAVSARAFLMPDAVELRYGWSNDAPSRLKALPAPSR